MAKLLIEVECARKTCGTCDLREFGTRWRQGLRTPVIYCLGFVRGKGEEALFYRVTKGRRHSACLAAERKGEKP